MQPSRFFPSLIHKKILGFLVEKFGFYVFLMSIKNNRLTTFLQEIVVKITKIVFLSFQYKSHVFHINFSGGYQLLKNKQTHDFLNELLGYFSYLKRAEPISNEAKDIASIIHVTPNPLSIIVFKSFAGSPKKTTKLKKRPIISTIIAPIIIIIFPFSISNTSCYEIVFQLLNSWEAIFN